MCGKAPCILLVPIISNIAGDSDLVTDNGAPIGNDHLGIKWSRDRWRHVTVKCQGRDPNTLRGQYSQVHYVWISSFVQYSWRFVNIYIFWNIWSYWVQKPMFPFSSKTFWPTYWTFEMAAIRQPFCPLFCAQVRYDDEFGGYPYIFGANGNDGAIQNIFGWRPLSNPRWLPSIGSHGMKYWTAMYTWKNGRLKHTTTIGCGTANKQFHM